MQYGAPSCTGFGFSQMVYGTALMAGYQDQAFPSPLGIYGLGRMWADRSYGTELENNGAIPSYVAESLVRYGVPCEVDPGMAYTDSDAVLRLTASAVIAEEGPARVAALRRALQAGLVPAFSMDVDEAYMALGPGDVYSGRGGENKGGHMQAFSGYREDGALEVCGSWQWASGGFTWLTPEVVGDIGLVHQIFIARVVPHIPTL